jgi:transposase
MRQIRQILKLAWEAGLKRRQVARCLSLSPTTVSEYLGRAERAGLTWPLPPELDDAQLEAKLYSRPALPKPDERPLPDWSVVHGELKRKGVTLMLLWQEYKACHPQGLQYSQFCERYRQFAGRLDLPMRHTHRAGEKLFVDYAGQTAEVVDRETGEIRQAQIFVATLGASSYTYAEATWSQTLPDWIASHVRALAFFGAVPALLVPDNLRSAVNRPCRYEPQPHATYQEMADHYGTAILPARVARPRDKPKVENAVLLIERWILARLRHQRFFSLAALNSAIAALLEPLNTKPFRKLPGSRRTLFETLDRPAMRPLPMARYEYAEWKRVRVNIDYHVEIDGHYYSVPYQLVRHQLEARFSATTVECFHKGRRIASHRRSSLKGRHTTLAEHMPKAHQAYLEWTPQRLARWAENAGPATAELVSTILQSRAHPQQGFRSCLGILRLEKGFGRVRLEAACRRALALQSMSYRTVHSILKHGLENQPLPEESNDEESEPIAHANIRGANYYY